MTVKQLIEKLQQEAPDRLVVCQRDAWGNGYSALEKYWTGAFRSLTIGMARAGLEKLTAADRKDGFTEEDVVRDGVPALFLVPVD